MLIAPVYEQGYMNGMYLPQDRMGTFGRDRRRVSRREK